MRLALLPCMSDSLVMLAVLSFVFLPPILVGLLRHTNLFWLPGMGLQPPTATVVSVVSKT